MKKTFLKIVGYLSVALGFAGAFLPLVPTTPLLLLALWCFSRSSPKMNAWLLGNRMFGRYLKDYEQGRGIPKVVKVSSVIILWSSILFTTIVFTEAWWLRALLLLMALLVSVHILNLKTLLTGSKILVLIPTAMEGEKFAANLPPNVAVETIGIGPYRSAFNTYHHILRHRPRMAILAGIAGTYPGSGLSTGESRLVKAENAADLGSFLPEGFQPKFAERLECPHIRRRRRSQRPTATRSVPPRPRLSSAAAHNSKIWKALRFSMFAHKAERRSSNCGPFRTASANRSPTGTSKPPRTTWPAT